MKKFLPLLLLFFFNLTMGQNDEVENLYKYFDSFVGNLNTSIYNGKKYQKQYRTIKDNHEFFISSEYHNGDIIYDNLPYFNVKLKYNIYDDQVIVKLPSQTDYVFIELIKEKVSEFSINEDLFINAKIVDDQQKSSKNIFLLTLYDGKIFNLYKDFNKILKRHFLDKGFRYNSFKDKNNFYLFFKKKYYKIASKKDIVKLLPEKKQKILEYYKKNKILAKTNADLFLVNLFKSIDK